MRITIIDGFRGFFLVFMMIMHSNEVLKATIGKLNHHYFGWVEDAQGFVFLSGLVVGLVYGGRMIRKGNAVMKSAVWQRIRTIWSHQASLILIFLVAALLLPAGIGNGILRFYQNEPVVFTTASMMLVTGSRHMGILPMYIFFMMVTPFVLRKLAAGQFATLATLSISLWLFAQTGITDVLTVYAETLAAEAGHPIRFGIFFNVFAWQIVFFGGLAIGYLMASNQLKTEFLYRPEVENAVWVALGAIICLGLLDRAVFDRWISEDFTNQFLSSVDRGNFSALFLLAFCLDLFVIVWLLGPGQTARSRLLSSTSRLFHRVFTWRPLVFLGQHSLHVFSAHILLVYILWLTLYGVEIPPLIANGMLLLSPLPLYLAAYGHAWLTEGKGSGKAATRPVNR